MLSDCLKCNNKKSPPKTLIHLFQKLKIVDNDIKCAIYGTKKSRSIKKQVAKGLLTILGFKIGLDKIPFLVIIFFKCNSIEKR